MDRAAPRYESETVQAFHEYWLSKCDGDSLPGRARIDPIEIPSLLPAVFLVDIVQRGQEPRFRFRLIGTEIVEAFGRDSTGGWLDEVYDEVAYLRVRAAFLETLRTKRPQFDRLSMPLEGKDFIKYDRIICPLASDGETVDMLIGVIVFLDASRS